MADKVGIIGNNTIAHYEEFIIEALALDRVSLRESENPNTHHIASEGWSHDPDMLLANMYELTESICYNYWCVRTARIVYAANI